MQWNKNINNPCETNFKNSLLIFIHSMSRVHLISLEFFIICLELNRFFPANFKLTNSSVEHTLKFFLFLYFQYYITMGSFHFTLEKENVPQIYKFLTWRVLNILKRYAMNMVSSFTTKTPTIHVKPRRQESKAQPFDQYLLHMQNKSSY